MCIYTCIYICTYVYIYIYIHISKLVWIIYILWLYTQLTSDNMCRPILRETDVPGFRQYVYMESNLCKIEELSEPQKNDNGVKVYAYIYVYVYVCVHIYIQIYIYIHVYLQM